MPVRLFFRFTMAFLMLTAVVVVVPASSSAAAQAITVQPNVDLVDGQIVTVQGSGFPPSTQFGWCEGVITANPTVGDCGIGTAVLAGTTDANGAFSGGFKIRRFLTPANTGVTVDCADPSNTCGIGAAPFPAESPISNAVLAFRPQPPGMPRPDLIVRNRGTGELYGDNVYSTTGAGVQTRTHVFVDGKWVYAVVVQNDGTVTDDLIVTMPSIVGAHHIDVFFSYFNVTSELPIFGGNGLLIPNLAPGQTITLAVRVMVNDASLTDEVLAMNVQSKAAFELTDQIGLRVCKQIPCDFMA